MESFDEIYDFNEECNFFDQLINHDQDEWEDSAVDYIEDQMELINNYDYNLNSPLLFDDILELYKGLDDGQDKSDNALRYNYIKYIKFNHIYLQFPDMKIYSDFFISELYPESSTVENYLSKFQEIFQSWGGEINEASEVLKAFLRGWFQNRMFDKQIDEIPKRLNYLPDEVKVWLMQFIKYHKIILIMNARSEMEKTELARKEGLIIIKNSKSDTNPVGIILVDKGSDQEWIIWENAVLLLRKNLLFNRNYLLMIKDVMISRSQSLISMVALKFNKDFADRDIKNIMRLYRHGDDIIHEHGNKAYNGIKMLEPICNLRITELARSHRDKIPDFPKFRNHILNKILELKQDAIDITQIFTLISQETDLDMLLVYYGSFRHWGHPFILYLDGLKKLNKITNQEVKVDQEYARILASDLSFKVLREMFLKKKKWFVDHKKMDKNHILYPFIKGNTWPTQSVLDKFGDHWESLPIIKCFDIPDMIDPSVIYSDKSHSYDRSEVIRFIQDPAIKRIPTKRVLSTMISKTAKNWPEFLKEINDHGLEWEKLVIGLKAKERELKIEGRFFSLMSYDMRDYFVMTEYLIKKYYVPLFKGLTMADDQNTVVKKMLKVSKGQGLTDYKEITFANHLDYEKWNNYQRRESNGPVFRVMGQFLGLPHLIERTHEFFENSLIYYNGRPDLMYVRNKVVHSKGDDIVCWEGQKGGLEGLRQKGWSVLNCLMIERESKIRNTQIGLLAQGDNQVITTHYKVEPYQNDNELIFHINNIISNNNRIMDAIIEGTEKLGLKINMDETIQSADYINYGKVPIYRGNILGLNQKRWSRVNYVSNDQLPSCSSILNSASTNALTVCHFSKTFLDAMCGHLLFGSFGLMLLHYHNPALRKSTWDVIKIKNKERRLMNILLLYLDPTLGGIGGTSLNRFLIRAFGDPVTESLSFWKFVYNNTSDVELKNLAVACGNPKLAFFKAEDMMKLAEKPSSLNLKRNLSYQNMIKLEVKNNMIKNINQIKNEIIHDATKNCLNEESKLCNWINSINPCFPRFINQFVEATYYGVTMSLMGLFINSKTIRSTYKKRYRKELDLVIVKSEILSLQSLLEIVQNSLSETSNYKKIWDCSSGHADRLRRLSWNRVIVGATIPHPIEIIEGSNCNGVDCPLCLTRGINKHVTVMSPLGFPNGIYRRGPYDPYLGSRTRESTSVLQPWEKETKIPVIKRASDIRKGINWFIKPDSLLAKSIYNNVKALSGEDWSEQIEGYLRTGSALHRFGSDRVSSAGFAANSPVLLSWCIVTTDTMLGLNDKNYDFMYQTLIIFSQIHHLTNSIFVRANNLSHYHIQCGKCLREIEEIWLDCKWEYQPRSVSQILEKWRPENLTEWGNKKIHLNCSDDTSNWKRLDDYSKASSVGKSIGFIISEYLFSKDEHIEIKSLLPNSIKEKIHPLGFLNGILDGLIVSGSLNLLQRRNPIIYKKPKTSVVGIAYFLIDKISMIPEVNNFMSDDSIYDILIRIQHKVGNSYPLTLSDLGLLLRNYLKYLVESRVNKKSYLLEDKEAWIFSDMKDSEVIGAYGLGHLSYSILWDKPTHSSKGRMMIQECQTMYIMLMNQEDYNKPNNIDGSSHGECQKNNMLKKLSLITKRLKFVSEEIRHAVRGMSYKKQSSITLDTPRIWGEEYICGIRKREVFLTRIHPTNQSFETIEVPYLSNPLISGLRLNQLATGAHYKLRGIIINEGIKYRDFLCAGDGSGGMTSCLLRINHYSKGIFNSLLIVDQRPLYGSRPSPPNAIVEVKEVKDRCVNLYTVWDKPSDLQSQETWTYFRQEKIKNSLRLDLIVLDMESVNDNTILNISSNLKENISKLLEFGGSVIFKSYLGRIKSTKLNIIDLIGNMFKEVSLINTDLSSMFTSEIYILCKNYQPGLRQRLYLDRTLIDYDDPFFFVNNSEENEFKRAIDINLFEIAKGVPNSLKPNLISDLSTMLILSGVDNSRVAIMCSRFVIGEFNSVELGLIIKVIVSESFINSTSKIDTNQKALEPLSSQEIKKMMSAVLGTQLYTSYRLKDINIFCKINRILNDTKSSTLYCYLSKSQTPYWSFEHIIGQRNIILWSKPFNLQDKQATIGSWIRFLGHYSLESKESSDKIYINLRKVEHFLKGINRSYKAGKVGI
ncbi:polymerase [Adelaide River virus]|uniref:Replicase n=4 Tax=Adelaide River virus TaxID=31612 RepID=K4HIF9_ARV|nr:polymerase [Adelaide River virus]AFR23540.1 polymerase [Adelaide River virus]